MRRGLPARPAASPRRAVARAVLVTRSPLVTRAAVATRATLVAALAALAAAAARPLAAQGADSTTVPVLFSVSGAASLGTYQSGVTWAVVRFLQLANGDSTLRPSAHRALRYRLGAISGASAGNINAVISSLEWCRKDAVRPENSLFAQLWLNVGLGQLNPVHDSGGATLPSSGRAPGAAGLMSRAFFQTLWDSLTAAMARPLFDPRCDIPVGVTMTRLIPAMYSLQRTDETDPALTAATQRFVARWRVQADSAGLERDRAPLVVRPPEIPRDPRLFGAEYLISIGADRSGKDTVDRRIVFGAVQASAAVPLVWAAVPLPTPVDSNFAARAKRASLERAFRAEARAGGTGGAGARVPKDSALFVDGGLFDADPLGLANDMWSQERATPGSREARPLLVRIDPDDLRGLLLLNTQQKEAASGAAKQPPPSGIEPVLTLLGGFLPSARGYELQSLGRLLARHANDPVSPRIVHTSRAFPAVAAHLLHFGGFMGRPFRDHDFYLGIYDGLRFAAEQLLCADPVARDAAPPAASCVDSVLTHTVIPAVERALPDAQPIPLVREFARCESLGWRDDACTFPPDTLTRDPLLRARYRVEATIARANQQMLHYTPPPKDTTRPRQCGPRACDGFVASIVWNDDFGVLLSSLAADTGYRSAIRTMHALTKPVCWGREAAWGSPDPTCPADSAFARLVNDPETVLDFALRWELRRLSEIEERQRRGSKTASRIAALTELAYTAQGFPYRTGHFAPTTVPALAPKRLAWNLLPYYVAAGAPGRGGVELGWDFVLRYWRDAHVGITSFVCNAPQEIAVSVDVPVQCTKLLHNNSGFNVEVQVAGVTIYWIQRNANRMRESYVPGLGYPSQFQFYGVRWLFTN